MMNERYDKELAELHSRVDVLKARQRIVYETSTLQDDVQKQVTSIISGKQSSEAFFKNVLDQMVIFQDRRIEVRLNLLPHKWIFVLEQLKNLKNQDPSKSEKDSEIKEKKCENQNSKFDLSKKLKTVEAPIRGLFVSSVPESTRSDNSLL